MALLANLEDFLIECPIKKNFAIDCLGCGFQRSVVFLLDGKLTESLAVYPATIPMIALWVFTALHLYFKFQIGSQIIKWLFIICVAIIIVHYTYKIATGQLI
jgi:hypothetical protein